MRLRPLVLFLFLFLVFVSSAWALTVPERPEGYVSDYAGMLSPSARTNLESALALYEQETSNQVVVVTFPSLESELLEDFSIRLAEKWKIGQKGKNNGVIFLIFKNDRKMRIEVGYGLEGALPDATAGMILNEIVTPQFRQGKFDEGISAGVRAIIQATKGEFKGTGAQAASSDWEAFSVLIFLLFVLLILFLVDLLRYWNYFYVHRLYKDRYSFWEWWFLFGILIFMLRNLSSSTRGGGRYSGGGWSSGGGGGGGFSGGGGSFGGGGSSGGW